jgi:hypothetical protein
MTYHAIHSGLIVARRFSNKSNAGRFLTYTYVHSGLLLLPDDETCLSDTGKVINLYPGLIL